MLGSLQFKAARKLLVAIEKQSAATSDEADFRKRYSIKELCHTWLIQGAKRGFFLFLATSNHSSLSKWFEHMRLFPDIIATNSFCADNALPDDLVFVALNLL